MKLPFSAESGCKGKEFFVYPPNFRGTFFRSFFSEPGSGVRFSKAGAKERSCFQTAKCFAKFFFESFFEDRQEGGPSAWASLAKGGTADPGITGKRPQNALQHHVKHQRFLSESGCKSTAYYRICKLIPTFFGRFSKGFSQKADLQVCYKAGFSWTGKGGKGKGHIISFRARAIRAHYAYNYNSGKRAYDICKQEAHGRGTRSTRDEDRMQTRGNSGSRRGKRWFRERKTMVYEKKATT